MSASTAAIAFSLRMDDADDAMGFLRLWNEGEFDSIRRSWPEAPEEIYGLDPLRPDIIASIELNDIQERVFSSGKGVLLIPASTDPGLIGVIVSEALEKANGAAFVVQEPKTPLGA